MYISGPITQFVIKHMLYFLQFYNGFSFIGGWFPVLRWKSFAIACVGATMCFPTALAVVPWKLSSSLKAHIMRPQIKICLYTYY